MRFGLEAPRRLLDSKVVPAMRVPHFKHLQASASTHWLASGRARCAAGAGTRRGHPASELEGVNKASTTHLAVLRPANDFQELKVLLELKEVWAHQAGCALQLCVPKLQQHLHCVEAFSTMQCCIRQQVSCGSCPANEQHNLLVEGCVICPAYLQHFRRQQPRAISRRAVQDQGSKLITAASSSCL